MANYLSYPGKDGFFYVKTMSICQMNMHKKRAVLTKGSFYNY
jgi:hypothetical protein